jgi:hypothetical protein
VKWRGSFYFMTGVNALSALCWFLFYHPPTFKMLHRKKLAKDLLLHFDWVGLILYTGSLTVFLLALSWGGQLYPWGDPHVIGCIVAGGVALFAVFPAWELWLQSRGKETFLPLHLFTNRVYQACVWITGIGAATYYGFSLVWPQAVTTLYTNENTSLDRQGTLAGLVAMCFVFGQIFGGVLATFVGPRWTVISMMWIAAPIYIACSANPLDLDLTMGLITTGSLTIGAGEAVAATTTTFVLRTQEELGTAGGLSGAIRSFVSAVATAIYSTVLANRLATTVPQYVVPAAQDLPSSSIPALIAGLSGTGPLTQAAVPGLTSSVTASASQAFKVANAEAYKTVFYTSFAFGGAGMILAWLILDNDKSKYGLVAGHVHSPKNEKTLEQTNATENK